MVNDLVGTIPVGKAMKSAIVVVAVLSLVIACLLLVSYPEFKRDMEAANERIAGDSSVLRTDKYTIEYSVKGTGPPVLVLHGAGGGFDQGLWGGRTFLGEGYRLVSVSRFGYLNSERPSEASIKSQAAAYATLLDHLSIDSVIVYGGSSGGPSAMQFASDYPHRCTALLLLMAVSMADHSLDDLPIQVRIIHLIQQSDYLYWVCTRLLQPTILELMGIPPGVFENLTAEQRELAQVMLNDMHPMSRRYAGTFNDDVMIQDFDLSMNRISTPTLILHAKDDALVGYHHAENSHKNIKHSELVLFENGGHAMLPNMYEVRTLARAFVSRKSKP
jgi:pimeloyl-ACP methyl ester carboxylesterase